ncbi:MAG: undecaprenyldiphospho-muramoylpentapeptide beta-N-acetylglucosaminyltransferase [Thermoanaerobaculaceae bacterium]|nr:undecaprenyldiphospho-muramoylpentapeptide beta-N-acetylglucosaminyltransferase [Thermoanaerobaculaceae bacterium]
MTEIVIAGGGTGGHLFPGLAVAAELERAGAGVSWLGAQRGMEAVRVPQAGIPIRLLAVSGAVARSRGEQAAAALQLLPAIVRALAFLARRRAAAVLAVGGYASLPGALAAGALGLPVVLQEQNARPGVANRFLAPWSVAVACGFAEAVAAFPSLPARWTGNPVRPEFFSVPAPRTAPVSVLVTGGSQGSAFLNAALPDAFAELARRGSLPRVVHQAGPRWAAEVRERYAVRGTPAEVVAFLERPAEAMAEAVLVIARAGALTIAELAAARRAALLVPFAAAAHGHQLANARAFAATGGADVLQEHEATTSRIAAALAAMLAAPEALVERGVAAGRLARPDAAAAVARLVLERTGSGGAHS